MRILDSAVKFASGIYLVVAGGAMLDDLGGKCWWTLVPSKRCGGDTADAGGDWMVGTGVFDGVNSGVSSEKSSCGTLATAGVASANKSYETNCKICEPSFSNHENSLSLIIPPRLDTWISIKLSWSKDSITLWYWQLFVMSKKKWFQNNISYQNQMLNVIKSCKSLL